MRQITVEATFRASYTIEVPDDWEYTGLDSIVEYDELSTGGAELVDWEVSQ